MSQNGGMVPRKDWEKTPVHQASKYSCGKCGEKFTSPHDVYEHIDTAHAKPEKGKRKR